MTFDLQNSFITLEVDKVKNELKRAWVENMSTNVEINSVDKNWRKIIDIEGLIQSSV